MILPNFKGWFEGEPAPGGGGGSAAPVAAPAPSPVPSPSATPGITPSPSGTPAPASAAVEPYYKDWLNADGKLNSKALDRLPEHLAHLKPALERQGSLDDLLTTFSHQQLLAGKKALGPLPDGAPPEARAERKGILDQINGVPKEAKDYGLAKPADLDASLWNDKLASGAAEIGHKYSASPAMLKELTQLFVNETKAGKAAQDAYAQKFFSDHQATLAATLKRENIPADKAQKLMEVGATRLGIDMNDQNQAVVLKNANVAMMAIRHALATGEDQYVSGESKSGAVVDPAAQAKSIVSDKSNPDNAAYWNPNHPNNKSVKAKVEQLYVLASKGGRR